MHHLRDISSTIHVQAHGKVQYRTFAAPFNWHPSAIPTMTSRYLRLTSQHIEMPNDKNNSHRKSKTANKPSSSSTASTTSHPPHRSLEVTPTHQTLDIAPQPPKRRKPPRKNPSASSATSTPAAAAASAPGPGSGSGSGSGGRGAAGREHGRGERKTGHRCPTCEKVFSRKDNLRAHMRVHTGEMPFTCTVCQRPFRWVGALNSHMKLHERDTGGSSGEGAGSGGGGGAGSSGH